MKWAGIYEAYQYPRLSSAASHELVHVLRSNMSSRWPNIQIHQWGLVQSHPYGYDMSKKQAPFPETALVKHYPNNGCPPIALQNLHNNTAELDP